MNEFNSCNLKGLQIKKIVCLFLLSTISYINIYGNAMIDNSSKVNYNLQAVEKRITGYVYDSNRGTLPGATILIEGSTKGVMTDHEGYFSIDGISSSDKITISFIGMQSQTIPVGETTHFEIVLNEKAEELDEVTIVAFGKQKKESVVGSITTVSTSDLRVPSSNLTTSLAGNLAGIISYQRSGEPGQNNADFFIRGVTTFGYKKDPLILIDGIETSSTDFSRLQPDDIQAFSILKDATATALYGARGANGVIQITTKEGREGPLKVSVRFDNSWSANASNIEFADPITFMQMANEATSTRNPLEILPYSYEKIERTRAGMNPYVYPKNDWREMLMKTTAYNPRVNINMSGGTDKANYYVAASYFKDSGNLKMDKRNNFNNNINLQTYQIRSNVNLKLTRSTDASIRINGTFDDYNGPIDGGEEMYKKIMRSNPVLFPAYYPSSLQPHTNHILFGNATRGVEGVGTSADYINPYAEMVRGYSDYTRSLMNATIEMNQELDFITKGFKARALFNTSRYAYYSISRKYNPYYYGVGFFDKVTDSYTIAQANEKDNPTEYLDYEENSKDVSSTVYLEMALTYANVFKDVHDVGGLLVYQRREQLQANRGDFQKSLPYRNQGLSGRFTYAYDNRYMTEFTFGYNGSERFHSSKRYGFFPALGIGWNISKELFWESIAPVISNLKLKATYGLVGNDAIGDEDDRFFYLSNVDMDDSWKSYSFGENYQYGMNGVSISRYENINIGWEKSYKTNFGVEIGLFNDFDIQVDYFTEKRTDILMDRSIAPSMGLAATVRASVGEAKGHGVDLSADYNKALPNNWWLQARGNFTYAHSEFVVYEEPKYKEPYRSHVGQSLNQQYGLIAERLFIDEYDVMNSPTQTWGEYGPGDIKYVDVNRDGQITDADKVPIGYPTVPEIVYGFGFSVGNRNIDFSAFFQGSARSSFWMDASATSPFQSDVNLLQAYADNHWSETNRDIYALWPRLSPQAVDNNTGMYNTWFMRDGSFLRLKNVEIGYTFPESLLKIANARSMRVYVSGMNLLLLSKFDMWDVEMGGNGLGYPVQRVINLGVQVNF